VEKGENDQNSAHFTLWPFLVIINNYSTILLVAIVMLNTEDKERNGNSNEWSLLPLISEVWQNETSPTSIQQRRKHDENDFYDNNFSNYQYIVDAEPMNLFGIPGLKVSSYVYGSVEFFSCVISVFSAFAGFISSHFTEHEQHHSILEILAFYIAVLWIAVPLWQNYSLQNKEDKTVQFERRGCMSCGIFYIAYNLYKYRGSQIHFAPRTDFECRFMPFSLYNHWFMMRNKGKKLNDKLPENIEYFGFYRAIWLVYGVNAKGTLNAYLCYDALTQLFKSNHSWSLVFSLTSLVFAILDLRVFFYSIIFGVLLYPFSAVLSIMMFAPDCCGVINEWLQSRRGSWNYRQLMRYWGYVSGY
jgi:hypothetical protein